MSVEEFTAKRVFGHYGSIAEFMKSAKVCTGKRPGTHKAWLEREDSDWYGLKESMNFAQVEQLINDGWKEGGDRIKTELARMEVPIATSIKRRTVWADAGDEIDMQKVWNGGDNPWRVTRGAPVVAARNIRIINDALASGAAGADGMFWQGAGCCALADSLTEAGYNVEMVSAWKAAYGNIELDCRVVTKATDSPAVMQSLAAGNALPAFFRCIGHTWGFAKMMKKSDYDNGCDGFSVRDLSQTECEAWGGVDLTFMAPQSIRNKQQSEDWIKCCVAIIEAGLNRED